MLGTFTLTATVLLGMVWGALERPQMVSSSWVTSFAGESGPVRWVALSVSVFPCERAEAYGMTEGALTANLCHQFD